MVAIRRARRPLAHWQKVLLVACVSLIVTDQFRVCLGDISGRYWPETWFHGNPSLIGNVTYGFHPFQGEDEVGSFPSGHAARILSFVTVWWLTTPAAGTPPFCVILPDAYFSSRKATVPVSRLQSLRLPALRRIHSRA